MVPKTVDQMVAIFRDLPLQWTPGERYAYNNSGYFLLGVVIANVTGKKYEEALQEMILTPLGLNDTGYDWSSTVLPRRASGYTGRGAVAQERAGAGHAAAVRGGFDVSTVEDLLKWDQALYTERLLPDAAKRLMWTPFRENYAYGWNVAPPAPAQFGGHARQVHGGGINGFSTVIVRLPEPRVTVIVLANNDTANTSIGRPRHRRDLLRAAVPDSRRPHRREGGPGDLRAATPASTSSRPASSSR